MCTSEKEILKVEDIKDGQPLRRSNILPTWHFVKHIEDFLKPARLLVCNALQPDPGLSDKVSCNDFD